jgi:hypothetical protein
MPLLTIQSAKSYGFGNFASATGGPGNYDLIATAVPSSSGQSEVVFTSIPNTYKHLYLTWQIMGVSNGDLYVKLNNSSANINQMGWNGSIGTGAIANTYLGSINYALNVTNANPHFGYAYINGYTGNGIKSVLAWNAQTRNNNTEVNQSNNTFTSLGSDVVNNVRIGVTSGGFGTNSKLALYGIKTS